MSCTQRVLVTLIAVAPILVGNAQAQQDGLRTYQLPSPHQAGETRLRVLLPDDFSARKRYRTLYVLPVHEDGVHRHGDGLMEIKKHGFHNKHQLICVAPSFTSKPWYADHDLNPKKQDESHLLKTVIPFVEKRYPVNETPRTSDNGKQRVASTGHESSSTAKKFSSNKRATNTGRLLIGFSKSGWGAATLLLRNPDVFDRAAAWDVGIRVDTGPIEESERAERIARDFGSVKNFEAYRLSNLIKSRGKSLGPDARLFYYSTQGRRAIGGVEIHRLLVKHEVPHRYVMEPRRKHRWDSGWIPEAIVFLTNE